MAGLGLRTALLTFASLVLIFIIVVIRRFEPSVQTIMSPVQERSVSDTAINIYETVPEIENKETVSEIENKETVPKIENKETVPKIENKSMSSNHSLEPDLPYIFVITPTYKRLAQKADLTRMSHTLRLVKNVHWIIIEDSINKTDVVENLLKNSGLSYTHLYSPSSTRAAKFRSGTLKQRGVNQRNAGLKWLRTDPFPVKNGGVLYFGDDDNTYSLELFEEMRYTKTVSVWPVGLLGGLMYEAPVVKDKKVVGWYAWFPTRKFAIDMCGFGVNLQLLFKQPKAMFTEAKSAGRLESTFLSSLHIPWDDLEPKAKLCTEILVWHTRTVNYKVVVPENNTKRYVFVKKGIIDKETLINNVTNVLNFEV